MCPLTKLDSLRKGLAEKGEKTMQESTLQTMDANGGVISSPGTATTSFSEAVQGRISKADDGTEHK